jgi:hypothetical protein
MWMFGRKGNVSARNVKNCYKKRKTLYSCQFVFNVIRLVCDAIVGYRKGIYRVIFLNDNPIRGIIMT